MLSDEDIRRVLAEGGIVISPFCEKWIRSSGIMTHLGEELLKPVPGHIVDVKKGAPPPYESVKITDDAPYVLQPGEFILGHTFQSVTVSERYGLMIEGRSTFARVGLTIVQTAMMVYPGHRNRPITLELANHGPNPIVLYPRMKIARIVLFELKTPSSFHYDDAGKYREQLSVGAPVFADEIMGADELE